MAGVEGPTLYIVRVFAPDRLDVVDPLHHAASSPEGQNRTFHLAALVPVRLVVDEVDGGRGPVVFAARVDRGGVEAALILGEGCGGKLPEARAPATEFLAQVVGWVGPDQGLRQVVGLDVEEPVIVGGGEVF